MQREKNKTAAKFTFRKSDLPFIASVVKTDLPGRGAWNLARRMQEEDGYCHQPSTELRLFTKGANSNDEWSMCELARAYYTGGGDLLLTEALYWWWRAARLGDGGSIWDIENRDIATRIEGYSLGSDLSRIMLKCAMMTEYTLTRLGIDRWSALSVAEKRARVTALVKRTCPILLIKPVEVRFSPRMIYNGIEAQGYACSEGWVELHESLLTDYERLIQVVFHELGHHVAFSIMARALGAEALKKTYGISEERVRSWSTGEIGYEVATGEEDPDTVSYGIYTVWASFFGNNK